jgi:hypothetical protein
LPGGGELSLGKVDQVAEPVRSCLGGDHAREHGFSFEVTRARRLFIIDRTRRPRREESPARLSDMKGFPTDSDGHSSDRWWLQIEHCQTG